MCKRHTLKLITISWFGNAVNLVTDGAAEGAEKGDNLYCTKSWDIILHSNYTKFVNFGIYLAMRLKNGLNKMIIFRLSSLE